MVPVYTCTLYGYRCQVRTDNDTHKCLNFLNYGRSEDPTKRTYSRMAFVELGLGAKRTCTQNAQ